MTEQEHPQELLAEYVDGTLGPDERARVESHLSACATCRDEVEAARRSRQALAALPEPAPPPGLELAVRRRERHAGRVGERALRWGGAAAVAAALVGFLVWVGVTGGTLGGGDDEAAAPAEPAPTAAARQDEEEQAAEDAAPGPASGITTESAAQPRFRRTGTDYDPESLQARTRDLAAEARSALAAGFPPTAREFYAGFDLDRLSGPAGTALACVTDAVAPDRSVVPFVIEEASFRQSPAYLAALLQGPSAEERYDRLTLMVVDREDCALRHFAFQRL